MSEPEEQQGGQDPSSRRHQRPPESHLEDQHFTRTSEGSGSGRQTSDPGHNAHDEEPAHPSRRNASTQTQPHDGRSQRSIVELRRKLQQSIRAHDVAVARADEAEIKLHGLQGHSKDLETRFEKLESDLSVWKESHRDAVKLSKKLEKENAALREGMGGICGKCGNAIDQRASGAQKPVEPSSLKRQARPATGQGKPRSFRPWENVYAPPKGGAGKRQRDESDAGRERADDRRQWNEKRRKTERSGKRERARPRYSKPDSSEFWSTPSGKRRWNTSSDDDDDASQSEKDEAVRAFRGDNDGDCDDEWEGFRSESD
ncbi:hypothetical protein LTR53_011824 [Teratosphaeriaceae sp. CCFEE 6253]|nr:hypothetical protein LTR53_011824 [Teratosphaeriaceae sp. CCFEE 6253]